MFYKIFGRVTLKIYFEADLTLDYQAANYKI